MWTKPSHRDTRKPQIETCELCGDHVAAADLVESYVEGLQGRRVCSRHLSGITVNPSFEDLGGIGQASITPAELDPRSSGGWGLYDNLLEEESVAAITWNDGTILIWNDGTDIVWNEA